MAGPVPKPTVLKLLEGNPGKRRLNLDEPRPSMDGIECPTWLDRAAKKEWRRLVPELERLGLLTMVDLADLAGYCQAWAEVRALTIYLRKHGRTVETATGYPVGRPEIKSLENAWGRVKGFAAEFGFSPSSRSRVRGEPKKEADPFDSFLQGRA